MKISDCASEGAGDPDGACGIRYSAASTNLPSLPPPGKPAGVAIFATPAPVHHRRSTIYHLSSTIYFSLIISDVRQPARSVDDPSLVEYSFPT
jgi:hypothetical protein